MCGIAGIVYGKNITKNTEKFRRDANLVLHRGPDHTGYYSDDDVDLVHHRLSILDLDSRSNQPYSTEDKGRVMVYNGELYNYKALAAKYNLKLATTSDTEVLYKLLDDSSFDIKELNGIFALAVYNQKNKRLFLLRDRLGVKPLYYYHNENHFIFSSEAKVIYSYLDELKIDYQVLSEYLTFGHSNSNHTIISGVKKVPPGTSVTLNIDNFQLSTNKYWAVEDQVDKQISPTYREARSKTKSLLNEAVKRQCISDVPVGAYLSGGIDSSAVVALASRHTWGKLNTYSVSFDQNPVSELKMAAKLAKRCGTNHHEFEVSTKNIDQYLPQLIFQYDEPFADPAMIPLHLMAEKASDFSRVVLQGDGGDEIFAGYGRHLDLNEYRWRKFVFGTLKNIPFNYKQKNRFTERYKLLNQRNSGVMMAQLIQSDIHDNTSKYFNSSLQSWLKNTQPLAGYHKSNKSLGRLPLMQRMLYTDMQNILPNKFLEKVDKVNMLHSIEARVPLLDNELVEYVMSLPHSYKIKKGITKYFLRDILKEVVPQEILNDKKKSFGTPIAEWLRTGLYDFAMDQFKKGESLGAPINYHSLMIDLQKHKEKRNSSNSGLIWRYLVLTIWLSFYSHKINWKPQ